MMFLKLSLNILLHIVVMAVAFSSNCLKPYHYDLKLKLLLEPRYVLKGKSSIIVFNNCATQNITFHVATYIFVRKVNMMSVMNSKIYRVNNIRKYANGTIIFNFAKHLGPDNNLEYGYYIVNIEFENFIFLRYKDAPRSGFLRTYWYEHNQKDRWMMAILNQPRTARELFPCLDEPELSATFTISVEHDKEYKVLSNMPEREYEFIADTIMITHFQTTPEISPNDVALLIYYIHHLHPIHVVPKEPVIKTWCRPDFAPNLKLGLYVAAMVTSRLNNEWNILKNVSKVDYVAVPNFKNKIWRTWGLIIYNEADITYNEKLHLPAHKFIMMRLIAHDIVSQWYSNFFDPLHLSHWWLNEGFILFLETYIVDQILDFRMMDLFVVQAQYESCFLTTNITIDRNNFTKDTSDTFKVQSILSFFPIKGAVIWRMLKSVIPDEIFWTSVNTFVKLSSSNSKTPNDLWNVMENETKKYEFYDVNYLRNVKEIMNIWSTQKYCPVLNVTRNYSNNQVIISKEFNDKLDEAPYFIPVTYTVDTDIDFNTSWPNISDCLTNSRPTLEILLDKEVRWIIVNIQHTGYYRVNYDYENWQSLARYLNSANYTNIHVLNRAQIIDDAFYFAINGKLDFYMFWKLASYLWREKDYIAWYPMIKAFQYTSFIFAFSNNPDELPKELQDVLVKMKNLFLPIPQDTYDQMVHTNNDLDKSLKQELARIACIIGNALCIREAQRQLELYLHDTRINTYTILPGWQKWVYCNGLKDANMTWLYVWQEAIRIYKERSDYIMFEGLLCSENPQIIFYYLSYYLANFKNHFIDNKDETIAEEVEREINSLTANIFLSTLSRHAKNIEMLKKLLEHDEIMKLSHVNINAALIVMINNAYSFEQLNEIYNFTKTLHISPLRLRHIAHTIRIRIRKIMDQLEYFRNLYEESSIN